MSELQLSLLVIGAVLILAVYVFNRLQERSHQRRAEQAFPEPDDDVLMRESEAETGQKPARAMEGGRIEPTLDGAPAEEAAAASAEPGHALSDALSEAHAEKRQVEKRQVENRHAEIGPKPPAATHEQSAQEPAPLESNGQFGIDPAIHYIALIHPQRSLPGSSLNGAAGRAQEIGKRVSWAGLNSASQHWQEIHPTERYAEIRVGLQLLDRAGPVSMQQLETFSDLIEDSAAEWGATVECPDLASGLASARNLDEFCARVDVLVGLNIVSADGVPFHGTKVRTLAESSGFKLNAHGAFEYPTEHGIPLFYLTNQETEPFIAETIKKLTTQGVTLLFDVPKVAEGLRAFDRMVSLGRRFSEILGGVFVDDKGRPLNDEGIDRIRAQLRDIYQAMEGREIPPGSARAFRLFS